ncbi:lipase family protein [Streptomyces sp. A7024]|uniref:Lipase family protein n=1 Tax=Streptomyces coryli TaxID=1128680 RepID=A0A6G4U5Y0_9ACTN|nr:lipase family protein [Streptomyces coryli]
MARRLGTAAGAVRDAGRTVTAVATDPRLAATALRHPRTGRPAAAALRRALTDPDGLGYAPDGGRAGRAARLAGVLRGRESLAVTMAVTALKLRIDLCALRHPELRDADGPVRKLLDAVERDQHVEAMRIYRDAVRTEGGEKVLATLAPAFAEIAAWNALVDENPLNDRGAWDVVTGRMDGYGVVVGTSGALWELLDRGRGRAQRIEPGVGLLAVIDRCNVSVTDHLRCLSAVGTTGRLIVQRRTGPDGSPRYLVLLAGMAAGNPDNQSPQDLVGAVHAVSAARTPYSRAVIRALKQAGIEKGAKMALVGHSQGGITAMNVAGARAVNEAFEITHVVAIGSPIDYKRPYDPRTQVVSLVNEHDVVPALEGRSPYSVLPLPAEWLEFTWFDDSHTFPQCHNALIYADNLDRLVPEARDRVDELLADYHGPVEATLLFRLFDR